MSAISCLIEQNQQHACRVCSIKRRGGFARNEWIRVSIFYHQNFMYLTVDGQICQLSPNERGFGLTDLYQINAQISDVLFVGGTYYKKTEKTPSRIKDDFKNHFFENTLEKAPSLRGCIAEIRVGGRILDLEDVVRKQNNQILADSERPVFSIEVSIEKYGKEASSFQKQRKRKKQLRRLRRKKVRHAPWPKNKKK